VSRYFGKFRQTGSNQIANGVEGDSSGLIMLSKYISSPLVILGMEVNCAMGKKVNEEMLKIDRRIISRKLLAGEISEKDLQGLLKKLPDVADNAEEVNPNDIEKSLVC
jgi:hypothetical protein